QIPGPPATPTVEGLEDRTVLSHASASLSAALPGMGLGGEFHSAASHGMAHASAGANLSLGNSPIVNMLLQDVTGALDTLPSDLTSLTNQLPGIASGSVSDAQQALGTLLMTVQSDLGMATRTLDGIAALLPDFVSGASGQAARLLGSALQ